MKRIIRLLKSENRQLLLVLFIIVGAIMLSRVFSNSRQVLHISAEESRLPVSVVEVQVGEHAVAITTTGRVAPRNTVGLTPQVSGRVLWVDDSLYSGGYFKANAVLFRIEQSDYLNDLAKEQAAVAGAQTGLALEQAEADAALAEWRDINAQQPAPPLVSRAPQIAQVRAELAAARARLAQAELNLSRTEFRLPFDGRVISSSLELGAYLQAGQSYGQLYNQEALEIILSLPKNDLPWISQPGQVDIAITFDELTSNRQQSLKGEILRIGASLDEATRFQQVVIKPIADGDLLPGMLTRVVMQGAPVANTWALPLAALQAGGAIWLVDDAQRLRRLEPQIIATMAEHIIVVAPMAGARVVDSSLGGAIEGAEVVVVSGATNSAAASSDKAANSND
ncbi:MAG: efflux RND transporter periplasmic adaptor subunit [Gammaproteobacteria bacterium]|nr:efflux RND transporter periplasmic adaptor subunit [Gammaproteobacteria bacterium]MBQ0840029.1 efflux RND transporter periplasmic adaptor subunit [Gammaproteobacteria bacterium]